MSFDTAFDPSESSRAYVARTRTLCVLTAAEEYRGARCWRESADPAAGQDVVRSHLRLAPKPAARFMTQNLSAVVSVILFRGRERCRFQKRKPWEGTHTLPLWCPMQRFIFIAGFICTLVLSGCSQLPPAGGMLPPPEPLGRTLNDPVMQLHDGSLDPNLFGSGSPTPNANP